MIRKYTFFVLIAFLSLNLFSQEYIPLLKTNSFWDVSEVTRFSRSPCGLVSISRDQIGQDTIIDNKTYKKIKQYPVIGTRTGTYKCLGSPYIIDTTNYSYSKSYFREDIIEKKIYRLQIENNNKIEDIYYDFSLKVGDTLELNVFLNIAFSIIHSIEEDSEGRKKFILDSSGDGALGSYYYTEGIGSRYGLFHRANYDWMSVYPSLQCSGSNMLNNSCNITLELPNEDEVDDVENPDEVDDEDEPSKIYPNPVNDFLKVENKENTTLKILSVRGKLLKKLVSDIDFEIDISSFSKGIYLIEISNTESTVKRKIIKL
jgi:hypothetical protein